MKLSGLALFASAVAALSVDLTRRGSPLDVQIEVVDNTNVVATITNTGTTDLKVLRTGSILDDAALEKSQVFAGCTSSLSPVPSSDELTI